MKKYYPLLFAFILVMIMLNLCSCRSARTVSQKQHIVSQVDTISHRIDADSVVHNVSQVDSMLHSTSRDSSYTHITNTFVGKNDSTATVITVDALGNIINTITDRWHSTTEVVHDTLMVYVNVTDTTSIINRYNQQLERYRLEIDSLTAISNHTDIQEVVVEKKQTLADRIKTFLYHGLLWLIIALCLWLGYKYLWPIVRKVIFGI